MTDCLFCKIIAGEIPCTKVYEDEDILAFLDINPVNIGHTLVIPKEHFANIYETPSDVLAKIMDTAKTLSIATKTALSADGINIEMNNDPIAGQVIFHTHLHVIPRFESDGFRHWKGARGYNEGEAAEIAKKIFLAIQ